MRKHFLIFGNPLIEKPEIDEVVSSLKSGWLGTGFKVKEFEKMFCKYKGAKFALAVNSCTAALHLSMLAIGLKDGDEVIVPTMTFAATANAVIHAGGVPVFADCQRDTFNIDPSDVERRITKRTKAVIVVHFGGRPCDMKAIISIARRHNLKIVEDCAHAIETTYCGRNSGMFGDLGCFSFYVTKNITTGEGGMVITNNQKYAERIKTLALHGMNKDAWARFSDRGYKHYNIICPGYKYNMMDIQAAIGIHQLKRISKYWRRRKQIWQIYNRAFGKLPIFLPAKTHKGMRHAFHLYNILVDTDRMKINRDCFMNEMYKRNIGVGVHYIALHLQPYYRRVFGYKKGDFPNAEWVSDRTISIPISAKLSDADVGEVVRVVKEIVIKNKYNYGDRR